MTMTTKELKAKLDAHKLWLKTRDSNEVKGERLSLYGANLRGANLARANLTSANLRGANLRGANLHGANLTDADLIVADLHGADLVVADLYGANLYGANLYGANLTGATLTAANLAGADLTGANLDYSAWPLWCGSLRAQIDKRLAAQLMYHAMWAMYSCKDDASVAAVLASPECVALANKFHHAKKCGLIRVLAND